MRKKATTLGAFAIALSATFFFSSIDGPVALPNHGGQLIDAHQGAVQRRVQSAAAMDGQQILHTGERMKRRLLRLRKLPDLGTEGLVGAVQEGLQQRLMGAVQEGGQPGGDVVGLVTEQVDLGFLQPPSDPRSSHGGAIITD